MLITLSDSEQGVTLIELLLAVVIIGVLAAIGAPSFNTWMQNSQIRNAANSIQDGLQQARAEAVRRNATIEFVLGDGSSWRMGCVTSGEACPGTIESRESDEGSGNVVVEADLDTISYNGLGRVVPIPAEDINIDVSNPAGGGCLAASGPMRCLRVVLSTGGQIRMCDPSLPDSNPRGC